MKKKKDMVYKIIRNFLILNVVVFLPFAILSFIAWYDFFVLFSFPFMERLFIVLAIISAPFTE
jgi:hypothetical protein